MLSLAARPVSVTDGGHDETTEEPSGPSVALTGALAGRTPDPEGSHWRPSGRSRGRFTEWPARSSGCTRSVTC